MHLEAMQLVLKRVYFEGKKVRRMDRSIDAVIHMLRDKSFDRLVKIHKGKANAHIIGIRNRHKKAIHEQPNIVKQDDTWEVTGTEVYHVRRCESVDHTPDSCHLKCELCKVCVHSFTCTCRDFVLHCTICKHIHAVCLRNELTDLQRPDNQLLPLTDDVNISIANQRTGNSDDTEVLHHVKQLGISSCKNANVLAITREMNKLVIALTSIHSMNENSGMNSKAPETIYDTLRTCISTVSALISAMNTENSADDFHANTERVSGKAGCNEPWNKLAEKQHRFYSTKKPYKRRHPDLRLVKPTAAETSTISDGLLGNMPVISRDRAADDHSYLAACS